MIGQQHDVGVGVVAGRAQPLQDAADLRVGERNFTVVRIARVAAAVIGRGRVRRVRVVEMQPRKKRLAAAEQPRL
jgi:hypothetical protein